MILNHAGRKLNHHMQSNGWLAGTRPACSSDPGCLGMVPPPLPNLLLSKFPFNKTGK
jgi:hypothetical protein